MKRYDAALALNSWLLVNKFTFILKEEIKGATFVFVNESQ